ncbi:MAG: type IV pilus secretin PilQ [Thermodesulfobacteriota bacterium]|nr:type IV pilus secretin PilQ [Thermodesulfobacteriota bacterium]
MNKGLGAYMKIYFNEGCMNSKDIFYKVALCFILMIFPLSGCVAKKTVKQDPFMEKWKAVAEKSRGYSPAAERRVVDLSGETDVPTSKHEAGEQEQKKKAEPEKPLPTGEITMKMHDIALPVLLRTLARAANQNIIINEKVKGRANINIKQAPWNQVFKAVLRTHGLTYGWEGEIIRIMTVEDMEHDLKIDAINEKHQAQKIEMKRVEPLLTRVIHIDYADAAQLKESLKEFLTKDKDGKSRGSVAIDKYNEALIIHAIRDDIERMIPLIEEIDRPIPQIFIEAHIVEATSSVARELGIQWGGLYKASGGGVNNFITSGSSATGVSGQSITTGIDPTTGMAVNFPIVGTGMTIGYVAENIGQHLLNIQLSALESEGKLKILSSPSITTIDNNKAIIESGKEVPYQTVDSNGNINIAYKDVLLKLEVTPHVIGGETLKMDIVTSKDEIDWANAVQGNPAIITKNAETIVILRDGQTTVIGGLSKEKIDDSESGVPGFKDIPLLGWLFKGTSKKKEMEELLIFITPYILEEQEAGIRDQGSGTGSGD